MRKNLSERITRWSNCRRKERRNIRRRMQRFKRENMFMEHYISGKEGLMSMKVKKFVCLHTRRITKKNTSSSSRIELGSMTAKSGSITKAAKTLKMGITRYLLK